MSRELNALALLGERADRVSRAVWLSCFGVGVFLSLLTALAVFHAQVEFRGRTTAVLVGVELAVLITVSKWSIRRLIAARRETWLAEVVHETGADARTLNESFTLDSY